MQTSTDTPRSTATTAAAGADEAASPSAVARDEGRFQAALDDLAGHLEAALEAGTIGAFFAELRRSPLAFLPCAERRTPGLVFHRASAVVRRLAGISPAAALAVENHFYVVSALATLPLAEDDALYARREALIDRVESERLLVANTNSRVHGDRVAATGTTAMDDGDGFRVEGRSAYMSLASEGDLMVFVTHLESGEPAIFACPLKGNPQVEVGDFLFPDAMLDSDTRRVTFSGLRLEPEHLLVSGRSHDNIVGILAFEISWHQGLLAALGLGVAERALEEARLFLRSVSRPDGTPLAELDGMIVDMGRMAIECRSAAALMERAGTLLADVAGQPFLDRHLAGESLDETCMAKYVCSLRAEDAVARARRIIGARSFAGGQVIERLSKEGVFSPLAGEVGAFIERRIGERILGEGSALDWAVRPPRRKVSKRANALEQLRARARGRKAAT